MRHIAKYSYWSLIVCMSLCLTSVQAATTSKHTMPDYSQWSNAYPNNGQNYCAPVAFADVLYWLSNNGFDHILPAGANGSNSIEVIRMLAQYFKTDPVVGSLHPNICQGLTYYLQDRGYPDSSIKYMGRFMKGSPFCPSAAMPTLEQLMVANQGSKAVLLNIGFYKRPSANGDLSKSGWHWVVLIDANAEKGTMVLHDPAKNYPGAKREITVRWSPIPQSFSGSLVGPGTVRAAGYPVLVGYPNVASDEVAIFESAIFLEVKKFTVTSTPN